MPDYNFLPAPLWLIDTLHIVTLTLHFIAMNFVLGGIIFVLFAGIRDKWDNPVVKQFVRLFPTALAATITFGVAPLLFVQLVYGKLIYAASIVSGWYWLGIILVLIVTYYFLYGAALSKAAGMGRRGLYLGLALLGMVYVSVVYSTVFDMIERPDSFAALYAANQSGWVINPDIGSWGFRWLHMLLGAVTVGSFLIAWLGKDNEPVFVAAKKFYLWSMVITMLIGFAYLFSLGEMIVPVMRASTIWTIMVSLILSLGSLHFLFKRKFPQGGLLLFVSLVSMVITRHSLRLLYLDGVYDPAAIPVRPQWGVFAIFLVCFLTAIAVVVYMVRQILRAQSSTPPARTA